MAYFFGGIALAVINGSGITDYVFVILSNAIVVLSAWCISSWSIEHSANIFDMQFSKKLSVVFDHIDTDATNNRPEMIEKLKKLFDLEVVTFSVKQIDYVKDTMDIVITYSVYGENAKTKMAGRTSPELLLWRSVQHVQRLQ